MKQTKTLNDVCELIVDCEHKTAPTQATGYPSIRTPNIGRGRLILDNVNRVSEETYLAWAKRATPKAKDLILAREAPIGNVAIIPENLKVCLGQRTVLIRPDRTLVDSNYLCYLLLGDEVQGKILGLSNGATVHHLNMKDIRNFELPEIPPISTQCKIAGILYAYDRLIENNTRRIKILEEMARSLYDEWFVKFRFPGYEQTKMVDSELGMIPEGWEVKSIGEVIETVGGGTPSTKEKEYWENGDLLWYTPSDLTSTNSMFIAEPEKKITALGLQKSSARMFQSYSVMMTSRATIGVVALNTKEACTNQGFITCIPNNKLPAYQIYFWILNNKDKIISLASGATFKEINKTTFRSLPIIIISDNTRESFIQILNPVCKQIENLQAKNKNLQQTRDLLLPKLISGEIDVENLDIEIEVINETEEVSSNSQEVIA